MPLSRSLVVFPIILLLCGFDGDPCAERPDVQRCRQARDAYDACQFQDGRRYEFNGFNIREECEGPSYCGKDASKECRDVPFRTCRDVRTPVFRERVGPDLRRCMNERGFGGYLPLFVQ